MTPEHFTLQGARAATTAESTGRATMFLGSVSAGLVALGLIAMATRIGTAFYAFGLLTAIADGHSGVAGFVAGGIVGIAILVALMEFQFRRFRSLFGARQSGPGTD